MKNGDRFVVSSTNPDGTMAVRRSSGGPEVLLPADYVASHVELAYATTAYRSQGRTTDTSHTLVSPSTTREVLYVAATRGRESNMIYVDTSFDPDPATGHDNLSPQQSAAEVLVGVLANEGADLSAHEALELAQRRVEDFAVLAAEYETLAAVALQQRFDELLVRSGLGPDHLEQIRQSATYGPLLAALRDAESRGLDVNRHFPELVAARGFDDAEDPASVMNARVRRWAQAAGSNRRPGANLVAGLIPRAIGVTDPDMARALDEREITMQRRARELAERAVAQGQVWVGSLGVPPSDPIARERWMQAVTTVAAYRDRWNIPVDHIALGPASPVEPVEALRDRTRAQAASKLAIKLSAALTMPRGEPSQAVETQPLRSTLAI
ncbi:MAG: TrwC relaxase [Acidimicrobiales bacterium]